MLVDLEAGSPSQGPQKPVQQAIGNKIPMEAPAQSGAKIVPVEQHKLPREVKNITKSLKQVIIGHENQNKALGQTPFKSTKTAPLLEAPIMHERPLTSHFDRRADLDKVQRRMAYALSRVNVLTGVAHDPHFKCPDENCLQRRRDTLYVCRRCGLDMLSHYSGIYAKAQKTLAESHAATKQKGNKK